MSDGKEFEIVKVRWCRECERSGTPARMVYAGTQPLSPSIRLVAFECAKGHQNNEKLDRADAAKLIKESRHNGIARPITN